MYCCTDRSQISSVASIIRLPHFDKIPSSRMLHRSLRWFVAISLVVQVLSLTTVMSSANANGLWTVSCAGKPMLLPLSGDAGDSSPMGQCLYCCLDPGGALAADYSPVSLKTGASLLSVNATTDEYCRWIDSCHPPRAPPVIR